MKKNVNKLMAVITTGILAATMSLTAFAANEIAIPKKVPTDTTNITMAPQTTFELEIGEGPEKETVDLKAGEDTYTYYLTQGTAEQAGNMQLTGAVFTGITEYPEGGVYTKDFGIKVPDSIYNGLAPGVYSYTVKEKNGGYSGITYDDTTYYMYVSVINDGSGGVKVDNVVLAKADGVKIADITNDFGATNNLTHDLTITKSVTGNAGELTKEFNFNISIKATGTGASADQEFKLDDGTEAGQIIKADESPKTVKLTNGNSVHIYGLTADYDVYVSEVEAGLNGYTTTYTITNNGDGNTSAAQALADASAKATVNAQADGAILTIVNERNNVTPTGVAMDIAPYALMVVLAGSAAVTFLRKKDQFEE